MPNFSGIWSTAQQFQARGQNIWPKPPDAPTIGTATAGTANCASVTFSAPACTGKYPAGISTYTVTSTPGGFTATGAASPLTVTGLTIGTSYTFKVKANGSGGLTGPCSAASNSITATVVTSAAYTTAGTYSWVAPTGVTSVAVVAVGGGGSGRVYASGGGGGGGGLGYKNGISVTPGNSYTVVVGTGGTGSNVAGGNSSFNSTTVVATGGAGGATRTGGTYSGCGVLGGTGGAGANIVMGGGGGAAGYSGNGGTGSCTVGGVTAPAGGGAAGGRTGAYFENGVDPYKRTGGGGGGGVGLFGQGTSGNNYGLGGSGGSNACQNAYSQSGSKNGTAGANYGGGGGAGGECGAGGSGVQGNGAGGAVRIVWCVGGARGTPSFPSTNVGA